MLAVISERDRLFRGAGPELAGERPWGGGYELKGDKSGRRRGGDRHDRQSPVNALSTSVAGRLQEVLREIEGDPAVQAVVVAGAGRAFVAGADIRELAEFTTGRQERGEGLHPLLNQIENAQLPYVCAVHGVALGAGLELAMACHYRVALWGAWLGQPEVKLGLIPGAGGTQRLPRLVGLARAAEMCAGGELVAAERALEYGLVDRVCTQELIKACVRSARQWARCAEKLVKTRHRPVYRGPGEIAEMAELIRQMERTARCANRGGRGGRGNDRERHRHDLCECRYPGDAARAG